MTPTCQMLFVVWLNPFFFLTLSELFLLVNLLTDVVHIVKILTLSTENRQDIFFLLNTQYFPPASLFFLNSSNELCRFWSVVYGCNSNPLAAGVSKTLVIPCDRIIIIKRKIGCVLKLLKQKWFWISRCLCLSSALIISHEIQMLWLDVAS